MIRKSKKLLSLLIAFMLIISCVPMTSFASETDGKGIEVGFIDNNYGIADISFTLPETEYDMVFIDYYKSDELMWGFASDISSYGASETFTHEAIMGTFDDGFTADSVVLTYCDSDGNECEVYKDSTINLTLNYYFGESIGYNEDLESNTSAYNYDSDHLYVGSDYVYDWEQLTAKLYFNGNGGDVLVDNSFSLNGGVDTENLSSYSICTYQSTISSANYSLTITANEYALLESKEIPESYTQAPTGLAMVNNENGLCVAWDESPDEDATANCYVYFNGSDDYRAASMEISAGYVSLAEQFNLEENNYGTITKVAVEYTGAGYVGEQASIDLNVSAQYETGDTVTAVYTGDYSYSEWMNCIYVDFEYTNMPDVGYENLYAYTTKLDRSGLSGYGFNDPSYVGGYLGSDRFDCSDGTWAYGFGNGVILESFKQVVIYRESSVTGDNSAVVTVYEHPVEFDCTGLDLEEMGIQDVTFEEYYIEADTNDIFINTAVNNTVGGGEITYTTEGLGEWLLEINEITGEVTVTGGNEKEYVVINAVAKATDDYYQTVQRYILYMNPNIDTDLPSTDPETPDPEPTEPDLAKAKEELSKLGDITITAEEFEDAINEYVDIGIVDETWDQDQRFSLWFERYIETLIDTDFIYDNAAFPWYNTYDFPSTFPYEDVVVKMWAIDDLTYESLKWGEPDKIVTVNITGTGTPSGVDAEPSINVESTTSGDTNAKTSLDETIPSTVFTQDDIDSGLELKVELSVNQVLEIPEEEQKVMDELVSSLEENYDVAMILDIDFTKYIGENSTPVTDLEGEEIEITIDIPENMQGKDLVIIRVHDGVAEILKDIDDSETTFTFKTDKFSTYALAEVTEVEEPDTDVPDTDVPDTDVPETGGTSSNVLVVILMLTSLVGVVYISRKKLVK